MYRELAPQNVLKFYWLAAGIITLLTAIGTISMITQDYNSRINQAKRQTMMFAQALSEQTTEIFTSLHALSNAVIRDANDKIVSDSLMSEVMRRRADSETRAVIGIVLADSQGLVTASGSDTIPVGTNLSETDEYKRLYSIGSPGYFINHPIRDEIGTPSACAGRTMTYSRAIRDSSDNFEGMVLILINENFLYEFYNRMDQTPEMALGLVSQDGIIRASNHTFAIGRNILPYIERELETGRGTQIRNSPITGYEMLFAYYRSSVVPLLAYSGIPTAPINAAWVRSSAVTIAALLGLYGMLLFFGMILKAYIKNRLSLMQNAIKLSQESQEAEFFKSIVNTGQLLVAVCNPSGDIIVTNEAFKIFFQTDELSDRQNITCFTGTPIWNDTSSFPQSGTYAISSEAGHRHEIDWNVSAIKENTGEVRSLIVLGIDITERRQRELAIYQSSKLITLGEMATGIAHEINQPLATLAMVIDNMQLELQTDQFNATSINQQLKVLSDQVDRTATVVRHMRIYGYKSDGDVQKFHASDAILGVMTLIGNQFEKAGIEIIMSKTVQAFSVVANKVLVEQILLNLLINAKDSIQERERVQPDTALTIEITVTQTSHNIITFSVYDTGTGLDEKNMERLFDPFFTTKPVGQGTGLGLALSYGMAKDMNGRLDAKNWKNGAVFSLSLPAADEGYAENG